MIKGLNHNSNTFLSTISSKKESNKTESVEKSRIESIRESVQQGTYKIDIDSTAMKMAKALL